MRKILSFILSIIILVIPGCAGNDETTQNNKLKIVTTIFPLYDFAKQIAGDRAEVDMLLPTGREAHSYEPTVQDIIKINESDLFINIGGSADPWVEAISKDENKSNTRIMSAINVVDTIKENHHDIYSVDEHIWTSPENAEDIIEAIANLLAQMDPKNKDFYEKNEEIYSNKLDKLDEKFERLTKNNNKKIVFADRFPFKYLAEEYNLEYFSAFPGCSSESEPSAATISQLIETIKNENINVVFYTETSNQKLADTISGETGAKKLMLHSCHSVTDEQLKKGITYLELMENNYQSLKEGLK
ncbi:MAG: zinc ABC transporter substrate-binding protein [Clostridia bacterium]|nr:zinc ABC transporter substrate-binding protein [Clostridia bacterium]